MARVCEQCHFYDASGQTETCPKCMTDLRFTLLGPGGAAPAYSPAAAGTATGVETLPRQRVQSSYTGGSTSVWGVLGTVYRYRLIYSLVVVPILLLFSLCFGINLTGASVEDKYAQLEVGMDVDEVRLIMDPPVRSRRFPVKRWSMFDSIPDHGPATVTWQENKRTVVLDFMDGELVHKSLKPQK
jgi:hypothetical protein